MKNNRVAMCLVFLVSVAALFPLGLAAEESAIVDAAVVTPLAFSPVVCTQAEASTPELKAVFSVEPLSECCESNYYCEVTYCGHVGATCEPYPPGHIGCARGCHCLY